MSASGISSNSCLTPQRLLGKVALVTGAATGIGESIARLFHLHGAKVCILDLQDDLGQHLCESLGGAPDAYFFHCDVSKDDDVRCAVDFALDKFGTVDVMVNNAGIAGTPVPNIGEVDISEFEKVFDVNVKGVFLGMQHAARAMIPCKKGSIVSVASSASAMGGFAPHAYTGSKHAVVGITKNVAAELGKHGIRVNCVSPYVVARNMDVARSPEEERTEDMWKGLWELAGSNANLQGVELTAKDVAEAVVYLASDEARYISGVNLMVDGGFTCVNHTLRAFR